jgi:flagellin
MALTVATNIAALMAQAAASSVNKSMETSMERLSTGKRINAAADDAAGVAIASRLTAEIKGTNQAIRNAMDAQALIDTAEGAHLEVTNLLQRMREIAVQASNDTNDVNDRLALKDEMTALTAEIDRIANSTSWAGQILLDGASPDPAATTDNDNATFSFHIGARNTVADEIAVSIAATGSTALGIAGSGNAPESLTEILDSGSEIAVDQAAGTITLANSVAAGDKLTVKINGTEVTITVSSSDSFEVSESGVAQQMKEEIDKKTIAGLNVSRTNGVLTLNVGTVLDITTSDKAETAIGTIDAALSTVSNARADLGAVSNRLDSTVANLTNVSNNLAAGKGRIEDADFANETTNLARAQILQQASTAMLAQANAAKQNVLSLLQG